VCLIPEGYVEYYWHSFVYKGIRILFRKWDSP
jgi:hypothetical protein